MDTEIANIFSNLCSISHQSKTILSKVANKQRISDDECLYLYEKGELSFLAFLANSIRESKNQDLTFFNKNFHIEPTNICIHNCEFCSYRRAKGEPDAWELSINEILEIVNKYKETDVTEVHIVGGVHPLHDIYYYGRMISEIKKLFPLLHIKAFSAIELDYMIKNAGLNYNQGLKILKESGLQSIPGGGAEIFAPEIREKVCNTKTSGENWLKIHEEAHKLGIPSNATMLYGHIEKYYHRVDHLRKLRELQDKTGMFNAFIPLKYRSFNNPLSLIGEVSVLEDLKNYAISRIYLDNFKHIKAYWPMLGKETTQLSLSFGVDDIDGTVDDSTKIYSMAGVKDKQGMSVEELVNMIKAAGRTAVERDSVYNIIKKY